jgi:FtsH-binding integral membrane protein
MMFSEFPVQGGASKLMQRVYSWMFVALALSAATAYGVANYPPISKLVFGTPLMWVIIIAQFALVVLLSARIEKMSYQNAVTAFVGYAFLSGITLASIFLLYTAASIALTFIICSAMFGTMAVYGYVTKADLSSLSSVLFMGLIGLIVCSFINMFVGSNQFAFIISIFGVIIFTLLTAFDVQKIKQLGQHMLDRGEDFNKVALLGALQLYLDFINLFLYLLQLFGKRRD